MMRQSCGRPVCRCYQGDLQRCRLRLWDYGIGTSYGVDDVIWPKPEDPIVYIVYVKNEDYQRAKRVLGLIDGVTIHREGR